MYLDLADSNHYLVGPRKFLTMIPQRNLKTLSLWSKTESV